MVYKIKVPPWYAVQMGSVADSRTANILLQFNLQNFLFNFTIQKTIGKIGKFYLKVLKTVLQKVILYGMHNQKIKDYVLILNQTVLLCFTTFFPGSHPKLLNVYYQTTQKQNVPVIFTIVIQISTIMMYQIISKKYHKMQYLEKQKMVYLEWMLLIRVSISRWKTLPLATVHTLLLQQLTKIVNGILVF